MEIVKHSGKVTALMDSIILGDCHLVGITGIKIVLNINMFIILVLFSIIV